MTLGVFSQWVAIIALLLGIGNVLWAWLSMPNRDTNKRIDEAEADIAKFNTEAKADLAVLTEGMKGHDRRIQRVEDDMRHLPTKDDLQAVSHKVTSIKTELDIVAKTLGRIDDFLRKP